MISKITSVHIFSIKHSIEAVFRPLLNPKQLSKCMCVRNGDVVVFCHFPIGFWNTSNGVVFFISHFRTFIFREVTDDVANNLSVNSPK